MSRRSRLLMPAVVLLAVAAAAAGVGGTLAAFTSVAENTGNEFTIDALAAPTGLTAVNGPTVSLSWAATTSTWASGYRVYRGSTQGGPYSQIAEVVGQSTTTYVDTPPAGTSYYVVGAYYAGTTWISPTSNEVVRRDSVFVFSSSTGFTGTNCANAQKKRDMQTAYSPAGPEESHRRSGGTGTVSFCSDAFPGGQTLAAGTTTVSAYFNNTAASACTITARLYRNGTTQLGSGSTSIPALSAKTLRSWSFATATTALAAGDRLGLHLTWANTTSCNSTNLYWNAAASASQVTVPTISG
jgi:predicted ribosomally synthesized peptide with SipW-like signal peptide